MARILIAGATGTLGRHLVEIGAEHGHTMVALVRESGLSKIDDLRSWCDDFRIGDLTRPDSLPGACESIDVVVSTVGMGHNTRGPTHDEVDYLGNKNLLEVAKREGVGKFIFVSVIFVDKVHGIALIDAKRRFEKTLIDSGINFAIYRPTGFYKDVEQLYRMARKGFIVLFGNGTIQSTPLSPRDLSQTLINKVLSSQGIVEYGGPQTLSWNQIANICANAAGGRVKIIHVPCAVLTLIKGITKVISPRQYVDLKFLAHIFTHDSTAPEIGTTTLQEYYDGLPDT